MSPPRTSSPRTSPQRTSPPGASLDARSVGTREVTVTPLDVGWAVGLPDGVGEMLFQSGAAAEAAARRLAQRLSHAGLPAKLVVRLRDGSVAGRFLFPPRLDADGALQAA